MIRIKINTMLRNNRTKRKKIKYNGHTEAYGVIINTIDLLNSDKLSRSEDSW